MSEKRVIAVTGASRGIGRAIAVDLAETAHEVIINYHSSSQAAEETAAAVSAKGAAPHLYRFNVSDPEE